MPNTSKLSSESGIDSILLELYQLTSSWNKELLPYQLSLFYSLAAVYFVFTLHRAILRKADGLEILIHLALMIFKIHFFKFLMLEGPRYCGLLISDFQKIGAVITKVPALSPGVLFDHGVDIAILILNFDYKTGIMGIFSVAIISSFAALAVFISYALMSSYMLLLLAISAIVLGPGSIVLAFTATSWTIGMLKGYLDFVLNMAVRLFTIYLVVALAQNFAERISKGIQGMPTADALQNILYAAGVSGLIAVLTICLPSIAASITTGVISLRNEDFIDSLSKIHSAFSTAAKGLISSGKVGGRVVSNSSQHFGNAGKNFYNGIEKFSEIGAKVSSRMIYGKQSEKNIAKGNIKKFGR